MEKYKQKRLLVTCTCEYCGAKYQKPASEYNRNIKMHRHNFCSRSCAGKYVNSLELPLTEKQLQNQRNIKLYSGNHRDEYSPFRELYRRVKARYKEVNLTLEDLKQQWELQQGKCAYTSLLLILPSNKHKTDIRYTASLDRIDSTKGYIKGNIQYVAMPINFMKHTLNHNTFVEYLKEITTLIFIKDQTISSSSNIEEQDAQAGN